MGSSRPAVTFVVPSPNRSGGLRVTVEMANGLLARGYPCRIAYPRSGLSSAGRLARVIRNLRSGGEADWLESFRGDVTAYRTLQEVGFAPGEAVIAVGSLTVLDVAALEADVAKVRYCHGFTRNRPDLMGPPWSVPMPTIAVAPGLVEEVERRTGEPLLGVVPNAVSPRDYFPQPDVQRDGIGAVYYEHHSKAPEELLAVLARIRERWPSVPQHVFGMSACPRGLPKACYTRAPSVEQARRLYSACRVWLVTSRYEGFGLPMLEAMACGTPVVTTRHDGCEGLMVSGENGFVVPFGEWDAYVDRVATLLEDDAVWCDATARAIETAKRFSWDRSVDLMEQSLQRLWQRRERLGAIDG